MRYASLLLLAASAYAQTLGVAPNSLRTVLTANVGLSDTSIHVAVCDKITAGMLVNVDVELMTATSITSSPCVVGVTRAVLGTVAARHYTGAIVSAYLNPDGQLNVKAFGARGDGTTDDTVAIRAAMSSVCSAGGGTLYVTQGTYIIAPTVAANPIIPICSNLTLTGTGTIKIKNSAGNYRSIFGPSVDASGVSNFTISGITIDQNSANNAFVLSPFQPRIAIFTGSGAAAGNGTNNNIDNVHITNVRAEWAIYVSSTNSRITNNLIDNVGGGAVDTDTSLIYTESGASGAVVTGNTVQAASRNANMAKSAFEIHDTAVFTGNISKDMLTGANLVGASYSTVNGITATGNSITGAYAGIVLWSGSGLGASGCGLQNATVTGNNVVINQRDYLTVGGAMFGIGMISTANLPFCNISIKGNQTTFDLSSTGTDPINSASIGVGYWDSTNANSCVTCDFSGNVVVNAPAAAFRFSAGGTNINFSNETAINPGSSPNSGLAAVFRSGFLLSNAPAISGVINVGGSFIDQLATARMVLGIALQSGAGPNTVLIGGTYISCAEVACGTMVASGRSILTSANDVAQISATVNVPSAVALPSPNIAAQSTLLSLRDSINYLWDGYAWSYVKPHSVAPTSQSGGSTTCGTAPVIAGSDRSGIIVPTGGAVTSCTVTFGTAFLTQPAISFTQLSNPAAGITLAFAGTGSPAFTTGFTVTSTALQGGAITWNIPAATN